MNFNYLSKEFIFSSIQTKYNDRKLFWNQTKNERSEIFNKFNIFFYQIFQKNQFMKTDFILNLLFQHLTPMELLRGPWHPYCERISSAISLDCWKGRFSMKSNSKSWFLGKIWPNKTRFYSWSKLDLNIRVVQSMNPLKTDWISVNKAQAPSSIYI